MTHAVAVAIAFALSPAVAAGQVASLPSPPAHHAEGTGTIRGRVVDAQNGLGIARAAVRLIGPLLAAPRDGTTDEAGAFSFSGLPAGNFSAVAEKSTYLPGNYPVVGQTVRARHSAFILNDGQALEITIRLHHGGALAGRVLDAWGDPMDAAQVSVLRVPKWGGPLQMRSSTASDDRGEYRISRLEPGRYVLMATPSRRRYVQRPENTSRDPEPLPTFYPGVTSAAEATPVVVDGDDTTTIDLIIQARVAAEVRGIVFNGDGRPSDGGVVTFRPIARDLPYALTFAFVESVGHDGTFTIRVPPGDYAVQADIRSTGVADGRVIPKLGLIRLSVGGDMSGVTISAGGGARVVGRIRFDGGQPPARPSNVMNLTFVPADGQQCLARSASLEADGTFIVDGLIGTCAAQVVTEMKGWQFRSITYAGQDLGAATTFVPGQELRGVELVMTDRHAPVRLSVLDDRGVPTRDYVALIFSTNRTRWADQTASGPTLWMAPAASERADMQAAGELVTGEYYVAAFEDFEPGDLRSVGFLERASRVATKLTVGDGVPVLATLQRLKPLR